MPLAVERINYFLFSSSNFSIVAFSLERPSNWKWHLY